MSTASNKVTTFPRVSEDGQGIGEISGVSARSDDPVKEINALILKLQESTREAQARLRIAEEERQRNAVELAEERELHRQQNLRNKEIISQLQRQLEDGGGDPDEVARLREENKRLGASSRRKLDDANEQREAAEEKLQAVKRKMQDLQNERDAAVSASENFKKELLRAKRQLDEFRVGSAEAAKEIADLRKSAAELKGALANAKKQVSAIKQARDTAANNLTALKSKVARMEDEIAQLNDRCEASERQAPEAAPLRIARPRQQEQSEELQVLQRELEILTENYQGLISKHDAEVAVLVSQHDAAMHQLRTELSGEKPATTSSKKADSGADSEVPRLKAEIATLKPKAAELEVLKERFEKQRLETIELAATLENAQRDILEMSASLAEARLMLKSGKSSAPKTGMRSRLKNGEKAADAKKNVAAMRKAAQGLIENFSDADAWTGLFDRSSALVEAAERHSGGAVIRVSGALAELLRQTQMTSGEITHSLVRTLNQTLDFLAEAFEQSPEESDRVIADIRAYVVDDDAAVSEAITAAFDAIGISSMSTQLPGEAISELATSTYDLIVLDVGLPEIDGFQLGSYVRDMEANAESPIIYLTGDDSAENRNEATRCGGDDFLSKPFNLVELGLRSLLLVLRKRLQVL